jgi:hypothetical protein
LRVERKKKRKKRDCRKANCGEIVGKEKSGGKEHRTSNVEGA